MALPKLYIKAGTLRYVKALHLALILTTSDLFFLFAHQARVTFPADYPYNPPALKFLTKVWHPNVYEVSGFIV